MPDLPSLSTDAEGLLQRACTELSRRLRAGEDCQAETLLQDFPSLASDPRLALDLILTEFRVRQQLGQEPDPQDLLRRFPQWHDSLRQRLEFLEPRTTTEDSARTPLLQPETAGTADASLASPSALPPELGPHAVGAVIGQGGMGVVYQAHDQVLDRPVALKVLRSGLLATAEEVERFYREARASARLRHVHIVPIHGMGIYQGQHCFTMPLLTGGTLTKHLPRLRQDLRAGVELMEKVARAVQAAHEQGVVHRDLKPSNILLDEQGQPHVSDFGLAKLLDVPAEATISGMILGTPAYMAPEQAAGQAGKATPATDVWALGVILFEMLVGQRPFQGATSSEVNWRALHTDPPRPCSLRPDLPRELQTIMLTCLHKEPQRRYASAGALANDLALWLQGQRIQARPESWLRRAGRKLMRYRALLAAAVIPVLLLIVLFLALRPRLPQPEDPSPRTPQDEPTILQEELAKEHSVDLLTPAGLPRWSRSCLGGGSLDTLKYDPGAFILSTWKLDAFELLDQVPLNRYRFRAEVRQENTNRGFAGIFFLHSTQNPPAGVEHSFVTLSFADRGRSAGQVWLSLRRVRADPLLDLQCSQPRKPIEAKLGAWRQLLVEVTPDEVAAFCGTQLVGRIKRSEIIQNGKDLLQQVPVAGAAPASFPVRGGLGVFAFECSVSFRKMRVEPFP